MKLVPHEKYLTSQRFMCLQVHHRHEKAVQFRATVPLFINRRHQFSFTSRSPRTANSSQFH